MRCFAIQLLQRSLFHEGKESAAPQYQDVLTISWPRLQTELPREHYHVSTIKDRVVVTLYVEFDDFFE